MDKKEFHSLIRLLDDQDREVLETVTQTLVKKGIPVISHLEDAWENSDNEMVQGKIENIIQQIHVEGIKSELTRWKKKESENLLKGLFILAKYQYPDLDMKPLEEKIQKISHDVWLEINKQQTALEKVRVMNNILFTKYQFKISDRPAPSYQNFMINEVFERKKGNSLLISTLYICIAKQLDIPVYGVNFPKVFLLAYMDEMFQLKENAHFSENILFYINPMEKGIVLGKKVLEKFLEHEDITPEKYYFYPCSNVEIIQRIILNLLSVYEMKELHAKIEDLNDLLKILSNE